MDNKVTVPTKEQLEKWFDIFNKKRKFEWLTFEDCQKKDGIYYKTIHWERDSIEEIKNTAKFYLFDYKKPFFSTIEVKNHQIIRLANNVDVDDKTIEKAKELFQDWRYVFICNND